MLGLPSEVEEVVLGRTGLLRNLAPGSIVIDMSTSRPELAARIAGL
jgi:3-hydroxyisobutyrate dehydrogenase-like beta-hydroxyacid dehydrogenase